MRHTQLRAFHQVAIHKSFSRAADALGLSQPAISDQIRKLEIEYDMRLFDRKRRQIELTNDGEKLLEITHRFFEVEQQAREYLTESKAIRTGTLKIIGDSPNQVIHILAEFQKRYPQIHISLNSGNSQSVVTALQSYDADIGLIGEIPNAKEFDTIILGSSPIIAFSAITNQLAKNKTITMEELARTNLVMREKGSKTRAKFEQQAKKSGVKIDAKIEVEGRSAVQEIVAASGAVGIVSKAEFRPDPGLVELEISNARLQMKESLICLSERRESKLIRTFMKLVNEMTA